MGYLTTLALFLTGDGAVRIVETFGNFLLLLLVLFMIYGLIRFMYQE
ncbi:MAG: hypothetical protein ABIN80_03185 [Dyadobacter sp.]